MAELRLVRRVSRRMKAIYSVLFGAALICLFAGCPVPIESRSIASVGVVGGGARLDYATMEAVFHGVSAILVSGGFRSTTPGQRDWDYTITGDKWYHGGFTLQPTILCIVELDRKLVRVRFAERESFPDSHVFPATDAQRREVRALAQRIEKYLRAHLPNSFQTHVSLTGRLA